MSAVERVRGSRFAVRRNDPELRTPNSEPRTLFSAWWARVDRGLAVLCILYVLSLPFVAHRMTASDAIEYYVYDRSLYFDHDLDFFNDYQGFYDRNPKSLEAFKAGFLDKTNPVGHAINNGPIGSALLWSPFFLAGDLTARTLHALGSSVAPDGYSQPYIRAVSLGAALYAGIGMVLTYLLARAITNAPAAFWATLAIWLATPAIFYSHLAPTYAHATSWFAASAFLTVWYRTRGQRTWRGWVALGLLGGLVATVREQDAVFLAVPAVDEALRLLGKAVGGRRTADGGKGESEEANPPAANLSSLSTRTGLPPTLFRDCLRTLAGGVLMGICALVAFTPQLAVYKTLNGNFRPSTEVSDKLHWNAPNGLRVLFEPHHGMFLWSPILLLAVVGLGLLIARDYRLGLSLSTGFLLTWYLNGAFQTWSTAGAFGARRFIVCSPIFAVGLAEFFRRFGEKAAASSRQAAEGVGARLDSPNGVAAVADVGSRRDVGEGESYCPEGTRAPTETVPGAFRPSGSPSLRLWVPIVVLLAIVWNGGLIIQFVKMYMDRQQLDWPLVFTNQFTQVPRHLLGDLWRAVRDPSSFYSGGGA